MLTSTFSNISFNFVYAESPNCIYAYAYLYGARLYAWVQGSSFIYKLIVAFHKIVNAPKNTWLCLVTYTDYPINLTHSIKHQFRPGSMFINKSYKQVLYSKNQKG